MLHDQSIFFSEVVFHIGPTLVNGSAKLSLMEYIMQHPIVYFFEEIASDKSFFLVGKSCPLIRLHNFKQNRERLKLC